MTRENVSHNLQKPIRKYWRIIVENRDSEECRKSMITKVLERENILASEMAKTSSRDLF